MEHRSIKNRVRAVMLLVCVIVLLATTAAFVTYGVIRFKSQLVRHLSAVAEIIADNSSAAVTFDGKETAEEILKALKAEPDVVAAVLYTQQGKLLAKYPASVGAHLLPERIEGKGHEFRDGALVLFQPVIKEQKQIGTLYIRSSLEGLQQQLKRYGSIVTVMLLASVGVAFVLSTLLQKRITDPILALTSTAQTVSQRGDYSVRAPKVTADELGTLTDAFNRMLAQTQEQQGRLAEQAGLLDLSSDAIFARDMENRITFWNKGAEAAYGLTREEALGKSPHALLRTEFPEPLPGIEEKLHRDGRWVGEVTHRRKDGGKLIESSRWSLDRDARGQPVAILETNTDITAKKLFEANLERLVAERTAKLQETVGELEAFSYSVSHDMRAPLRAMQGYAQALLEDYKDTLDMKAMELLSRISRAASRLDSLVRDVLAYSKVAQGDIALHAVDLESLVADILANTPDFQPPRARVTVKKPLHCVLGHEAYLTQCVTNILGNAVKFVSEGVVPEIHIHSERVGDRIRVWFDDNGIGIDPSHWERIFQIFGQVYPEKKYGGTGIGLAIVRKAVQRMGGEVGVQSQLDKGSAFWLLFNVPKNS